MPTPRFCIFSAEGAIDLDERKLVPPKTFRMCIP